METGKEPARELAGYLLQIKAIKLQPAQPFTWASGWKSPIYCDNRLTLSFPEVRDFIRDSLVEAITENFGKPDVIAGVATGAIAMGALVADKLTLPFIYVRPEAKTHGMKNQIEGNLGAAIRVVVVEDLISTGQSSLAAVRAIRDGGGIVDGLVSIFNYGFPVSEKAFQSEGCRYYSLCMYETLLDVAIEGGYIKPEQLMILKKWRENPQQWQP